MDTAQVRSAVRNAETHEARLKHLVVIENGMGLPDDSLPEKKTGVRSKVYGKNNFYFFILILVIIPDISHCNELSGDWNLES
jgi:hypothetical protein